MDTKWTFAGYAFPSDSLPSDGGDWDYGEKVIEHEPLGADVTVVTSLGFKSDTRVVAGDCSRDFRDNIKSLQRNLTVGDLVDGEGRTVSARIMVSSFQGMNTNRRFKYSITFKAR